MSDNFLKLSEINPKLYELLGKKVLFFLCKMTLKRRRTYSMATLKTKKRTQLVQGSSSYKCENNHKLA